MRLSAALSSALDDDDINTLHHLGIKNAESLLSIDEETLAAATHWNMGKINAIRSDVAELLSPAFSSAGELYAAEQPVYATACRELDDALHSNGLPADMLVELISGPELGKTQLCLHVACASAASGDTVLYMDAHGGCVGARIMTLLEGHTADVEAAARRISVATVTDVFQAFHILDEHRQLLAVRRDAMGDMASETPPAAFRGGVVILDSVGALVSPILGGSQVRGHALMMTLASELKRLAQEYQAAVLVTNSYLGGRNGPAKPGLGASWLAAPHVRLDLAALFA